MLKVLSPGEGVVNARDGAGIFYELSAKALERYHVARR
jgi:hypothetical protein